MNFYMHYKKSQLQEYFFVNSLYFKHDVFVNLFYYGNERSIHVGLMGFFSYFVNFFCF
jgi:hypothetical protein